MLMISFLFSDVLAAGFHLLGARMRTGGPPPLVCAVLDALAGLGADDASTDSQLRRDATPALEFARQEGKEGDAKPITKVAAAARIRAYGLALRSEVLRAAVQSEDAPLLIRALGVFGGGEAAWAEAGEVSLAHSPLDSLLD